MAVRQPPTPADRPALPHPRYRVPVLGDLLTTDPVKPAQMSWHNAEDLGPIFERRVGSWPMIVVSGTDLIAEVTNEANWTKHVGALFKQIRPLARDGLFSAYNTEPNWGRAHRILAPSFTKEAMNSYHDTMNDVAGDLVAHWADQSGRWVDVAEDMNRFTLEVVSKCGFDHTFNSFANTGGEPDPFITTMLRALAYINFNANLPLIVQQTIGRNSAAKHKRDIASLHQVVDEIIATRRASDTLGQHGDLLDRMLTVADPDTGEHLDDLNIRNQVLTFLLAGHETSAGVLSFALYELARNPDAAAKAREELDQRFPTADPIKIGFDDVAKLRGIRRIVDETLRLWPVAPGFFREARHNTTIGEGKYPFNAGEWVFVLTLAAHRDPVAFGENADTFDPDRWLPGHHLDQRAYKPFGTGLRACIGRQFAYHEIMLALAHLLHNFDFEIDPGYKLDIKEQITLKPSGVKLRITPRTPS